MICTYTKEEAKAMAKELLKQTDYAVLPDVALANKDIFITYRAELREVIANPLENTVFNNVPEPQWIVVE